MTFDQLMNKLQEKTSNESKLNIHPTCYPPFRESAAQNLFQMAERPSPPFHHLLCRVMEVPTETSG